MGMGEKGAYTGHSSSLFVQRGQWGWWVSWARDRDRTAVSWILLGRIWVRLYLKVQWLCAGECPTGLSLREAQAKQDRARRFGRCKGVFPDTGSNSMKHFENWSKMHFTGARGSFPGAGSRVLAMVRRRSSGRCRSLWEFWKCQLNKSLNYQLVYLAVENLAWLMPLESWGDNQ